MNFLKTLGQIWGTELGLVELEPKKYDPSSGLENFKGSSCELAR